MKLAVRFFFTTLLFIAFCFLFFKLPAFAQIPVQPQAQAVNSYAAPNTNPDVPNNLHTWTQNVMIEVMSAMTCQLAGIDPTNPSAKCLGVDQKTGKIGFVENGGGAIGVVGSLITMTLTPPIHTRDYIFYLSHSFGLTKSAYAAGSTGLDSLTPIISAWKVFRDIVYLLFVLIFVIIGIAIMFRVRIDPRTVMTIQNQIPKLIIGILLVTFSFAIAGFLIDVMWIAVYLFINILVAADPKITDPALTQNLNTTTLNYANETFSGGLLDVASKAAGSISGIITNMFLRVPGAPSAPSLNPIDWATNAMSTILGAIFGVLFVMIGGVLAFLIIIIALLWSVIKLWFALLEAYIMVLVGVIFAPFWIVTGLIPGGQSMGFGAWMREMLGNLAAFPTTIAMFLIGRVLIDALGGKYSPTNFTPPLLGNPTGNGTNTNILGPLIALGIIFVTPHIVKITKAAFKSPKIDLGPIGKAVGVGTGAPGGVFNKAGQIGFTLSGMANIPGINRLPIVRNINQGRGGGPGPHA